MSERVELEIDGLRLEAAEYPGDPDERPLVLLHDGLGSVSAWREFPERLQRATSRRVIAFSRFGHGRSDPPHAPRTPAFFHEEAHVVLPDILRQLDAEEPILVGHSDGASIALLHAAAADLPGLVVLAPHVFVEELGLREIAAARDQFTRGDLRSRMARHHRDPDAAFRNWNDVWLDPAFRSWDLRPGLPAITCPTLAVQGTADPYGTPAHVEAIRDSVPGPVELLLLPGGHAPHLEHPDEVTAALTRFLAPLP
jgi:pimeloyl-ACP methyl ester carboxylesterase